MFLKKKIIKNFRPKDKKQVKTLDQCTLLWHDNYNSDIFITSMQFWINNL